jgi:PKD repeat protein
MNPQALRLIFAAAMLFVTGAALSASSASAFSTPGGSGQVTLDSLGAPPSVMVKLSASPPVFQLNETLVVSVGDLLYIGAGVEVRFVNGSQLTVLGSLQVAGTAAAPVLMGVVQDGGSMALSWDGVYWSGTGTFLVEHAVFNDTLDLAVQNASSATLRSVSYQGRLFIDNASGVLLEDITMTMTPTDVGRPSLWIENAHDVEVRGADLEGGSGWGGVAVRIENSANVSLFDLVVRDDNANLVGLDILFCRAVTVSGYTFMQGKTAGDPNQALGVADSTGVWVERLAMPHLGQSGLGAIYGVRSNATIANSTFAAGTAPGVWQFPGTLLSLNTTRLPVSPSAGAVVVEYELVRVEARWTAGGNVALGSATLTNDSWNVSGPIVAGATAWLWALREVNASGALSFSAAYHATVSCNCSGGQGWLNLTDGWGVSLVVFVGDLAAPVPLLQASLARTGSPVTLDGSSSFDNAAIAAYSWSAVGSVNATGLPCAQAVCEVVFAEPGNFTLQLRVTDTSGNVGSASIGVPVLDATAPLVEIVSVSSPRPGQGEPFTVVAQATDNDPAFLPQVAWFIDGAPAAADTLSATLRIDAIGVHTLRVVVRDDAGGSSEASVQVEVRDSTSPEVAVWQVPAGLVAPATVELNGSVATDNVGVAAWRWRVVGPGTDYNVTGRSPRATFPAAGTYNVTLTVEDAEGNHASRTFAIEVAATPSPREQSLPQLVALAALGAALAGGAVLLVRKRQGK